jgi:dTDP-4-amino-4,6-dideoxygalactose transaminase
VAELDLLGPWNQRKTEIAERLAAALSPLPLEVPAPVPGWLHGDLTFPILTNSVEERDALAAVLFLHGIGCMPLSSLFLPAQLSARGYEVDCQSLPQAERLARQGLAIACMAELQDEEVEYMISCIQDWFSTR